MWRGTANTTQEAVMLTQRWGLAAAALAPSQQQQLAAGSQVDVAAGHAQ